MTGWSTTPPSTPGTYLCRFAPAPWIDRTPFEVELVEDTIRGGVCARDAQGMCHALAAAYPGCEWWSGPTA